MTQQAQQAPSRETYNYVLYLDGKTPYGDWAFASYAESVKSKPIQYRDNVYPVIFLKTRAAMMTAWRRGWTDLTEQWFTWLDEVTPKPTTDSQQQIIEHMKNGSNEISAGNTEYQWYTKSSVLQATGVAETIWRTAIKTLLERDLVEKTGFGKATKYRLK